MVQTRPLGIQPPPRCLGARRFSWVAAVFILAASSSRAVIDRVVEKNVAVGAHAALKIDTYHGGISVVATNESEIHVVVRQGMDVKDDAEADQRLHDLDLVFEETAGGLVVRAHYRTSVQWTWKTWPPVGLTFEIRVPRACDLDLLTHDGAINVASLQGKVKTHTLKGNIFLGEIDGAIEAVSDQGDVAVTACTHALTITAKDGNVLVGRANGPTEVSDVNGLLEIQNARGALHASGDGADLKIGFAHPLSAAAELQTSGGDITVSFDTRNVVSIDAHASRFGHVRVGELPLKLTFGERGSSHLSAQLNGGGPLVTVRASGGNIRLAGFAPMP